MASLWSTVLALLFVIRLSKANGTNMLSHVRATYGEGALKCVRKYSSLAKKLEKTKLDVIFLEKCKVYNVFPKFLQFKLYKKCLNSTQFYKSWQAKLLIYELNSKRRNVRSISNLLEQCVLDIKAIVPQLCAFRIFSVIQSDVAKFKISTTAIHTRKLNSLGVKNNIEPCDPDKVIFNFSSLVLDQRIKFLLGFGLDFCLPVFRLDFYKYFMSFEKLMQTLKNSHCSDLPEFTNRLKTLAYKYFYNFKSYKIFSSVFKVGDISLLRSLSKNPNIIVTRPDKGRGVVLLDKCNYISSVISIISDTSKFEPITDPITKFSLKIEDKVNNFLRKLKSSNIITDTVYNDLFARGSGPGILYGLPKIHKKDFSSKFQMRPIFAAYNSASFKLGKFLVNILSPLTKNLFTVENSYNFSSDIVSFPNAEKYFMASFDVENLFTNVPLTETIDICLNGLFFNSDNVFGFTRSVFRNMLEISVKNSFFLFNGKYYKQVEGLGMGLPLGPTFANIFMCYHEKIWLDDCPVLFKPVYYKRYIDDTFALFRDASHPSLFLQYLNSKHSNIKFTMEMESDKKLAFLDCLVTKFGDTFNTSVFRKDTFTGLGTSYFSFCTFGFKMNGIRTLLHRAYRVSSNFVTLHAELEFLKNYFYKNGFPISFVESCIRKFLCSRRSVHEVVATVDKRKVYLSLPYFGAQSDKLKRELEALLYKYFCHLDVKIVLVNSFTIGSLFKFKDSLPRCLRSNIVYKYSCERCSSEYVGSTARTLNVRTCEHIGKSYRTGTPLGTPSHSAVRSHSYECSGNLSLENFSIIGSASGLDLRILESLHIFKQKPDLNDMQSAFPLFVVGN